jgi:hypothetical protein
VQRRGPLGQRIYGEVVDSYGSKVWVQATALVDDEPHIWIFTEHENEMFGRREPYLNVRQARQVARALEKFIKSATSPTSRGRSQSRRSPPRRGRRHQRRGA